MAGIGGFSGRESEVGVAWLADMVRAGKIRWVVASGGDGGGFHDGRTGATTAMNAVAQTCTPVSATGSSSTTSGLYDCLGRADALARAGS